MDLWLLSFIRLYWSSNGIVIPEVKLLELPVSVWLGPIIHHEMLLREANLGK